VTQSLVIRVLNGALNRIGALPGTLRRLRGAHAPVRWRGSALPLATDLARLEESMAAMEGRYAVDIARVHPAHRADAVNLTHYLALRHADVRQLQRSLEARGLSSLGRCEPHVLATVENVRWTLYGGSARTVPEALSFESGRAALDGNTDALRGPRPPGRVPRVMVTLPSEAAVDYGFVRHLVASGMDVARINGAHDDAEAWEQMARNVRKASAEVGRPCRVSIDLPGPKLRTGPFAEGPRVVRLRPERDLRGVPRVPARAVLVAATPGHLAPDVDLPPDIPALPVDGSWLARRRTGDVIVLDDTRGSRRELRVTAEGSTSGAVEVWDTTYIETGTNLDCAGDRTTVGVLPPVGQFHTLRVGDRLVLTRTLQPAKPWWPGRTGTARIGCTLPLAFDVAEAGQPVVFDDGRIAGIVESVGHDEIGVRVVAASARGSRLRAEKGINLPETDLPAEVVTEADLPLLRVAAAHADMMALSFLRNEGDVDTMRDYLARVDGEELGIVLKIETSSGFNRLPAVLLHAMRSPKVGVMIARGDLAVEVGYERLAEMQEEILWLCEAARLPVIWATEVLDHLARTGQPSRAEVTDAAMAQRAECVMLNKGPHIDAAITALDDILRRMAGHQRKKTALLRPLRSWDDESLVRVAGRAASVAGRSPPPQDLHR
jgi:pyruvate kinase